MDYLTEKDHSDYAKVQLEHFCKISYGEFTQDIKTYVDRAKKNLVSNHPNDSLLARWGEDVPRTNCPAF